MPGKRRTKSDEENLFNQELGRRIETLRKKSGMTTAEVADAIGIWNSTLYFIEIGKTRCSLFLLIKFAKLFRVPVESLIWLTTI